MSLKKALFDPSCTRCARLSRHLRQVRQEFATYHAAPVSPFGDPRARLLIVGLAPGMHGANRTGRPFTGDHAGILLYETLHRFGLANQPVSVSRHDPLKLRRTRITNAVKCLPPQNKPTPDEVKRCNPYLAAEIATLPRDGVMLALGAIAHQAVLRALDLRLSQYPFAHGAHHRLPNGLQLLNSYHCSRYNTQTRRLTSTMFRAVVKKAAKLINR